MLALVLACTVSATLAMHPRHPPVPTKQNERKPRKMHDHDRDMLQRIMQRHRGKGQILQRNEEIPEVHDPLGLKKHFSLAQTADKHQWLDYCGLSEGHKKRVVDGTAEYLAISDECFAWHQAGAIYEMPGTNGLYYIIDYDDEFPCDCQTVPDLGSLLDFDFAMWKLADYYGAGEVVVPLDQGESTKAYVKDLIEAMQMVVRHVGAKCHVQIFTTSDYAFGYKGAAGENGQGNVEPYESLYIDMKINDIFWEEKWPDGYHEWCLAALRDGQKVKTIFGDDYVSMRKIYGQQEVPVHAVEMYTGPAPHVLTAAEMPNNEYIHNSDFSLYTLGENTPGHEVLGVVPDETGTIPQQLSVAVVADSRNGLKAAGYNY